MTNFTDNQGRIEALEQTVSKLQQELTCLRSQVRHEQRQSASVATGRRRFLKSLAGLGGVGVAALAFSNTPAANAKFVASAGAGAIVATNYSVITGALPSGVEYGFIATARPSLDLNSFAPRNAGIYGEGADFGLYGYSYGGGSSSDRAGVFAVGIGTDNVGVRAFGSSTGVFSTGGFYGMAGYGTEATSRGVLGQGVAVGIFGTASPSNGRGVYGEGFYGVEGKGTGIGVLSSASASNSRGVYSEGYIGVEGKGTNNSATPSIGVVGSGLDYAGAFYGATFVSGAFSATTKNFRIDHPQDPANRYLQHASIESDKMLNIYTGTVTLDAAGQAVVKLPDWFEILNKDFTYHLTPFGISSQPYIAAKIKKGQFQIAGGQPGQEISWLVSGVRQDEWAKANPLEVEKPKPPKEAGTYLHPELYGQPPEKTFLAKISPPKPDK
jgi:hypothetical protein